MKRSRSAFIILATLFVSIGLWSTMSMFHITTSSAKGTGDVPVVASCDTSKLEASIAALKAERDELVGTVEDLKREKSVLLATIKKTSAGSTTTAPTVAERQKASKEDVVKKKKNRMLTVDKTAFEHDGRHYENEGELSYVKFAMAGAGYNDWDMPEDQGNRCNGRKDPAFGSTPGVAAGKTPIDRCLPTLSKRNVRNELFFVAPCEAVDPDTNRRVTTTVADAVTKRVRRVVEALDNSIANHPGVQTQKSSVSAKGTARGWGITSPFTNKWRFYAKHLQQVIDRVKPLGRPVEICEVGFLAGHSMAVDVGVLGDTPARFHIFDLIQQNTFYAHAGSQHFKELFGDNFTIDFGYSSAAIPKAIARAEKMPKDDGSCVKPDCVRQPTMVDGMLPLLHCDFVSLDGSKQVTDYLQDLMNLAPVVDEHTIFIDDDHDPVASSATPALNAKKQISSHDELFRWLSGTGRAELIGLFHAEEADWKTFGNIAYKLKVSAKALREEVVPFVVSHYCAKKTKFTKDEQFEQQWCQKHK